MEEEEGPEPEELGNGWYQYEDEEGRFYYFNTITEVTQWETPTEEELTPPPDEEEQVYDQEPAEGEDPYMSYYDQVWPTLRVTCM